MTEDKTLQVSKPGSEVAVAASGIVLKSVDDLLRMARFVVEAGLAPKGMERPATCLIAIQTGLEAGLTPMASLRALAVINNRPSWTGKAALALVRQSGALKQSPTVTYRGQLQPKAGLERYGDDFACEVSLWRVGDPEPHRYTFSVEDAKQARLWGKTGQRGPTPWVTFPKRMLYWRALSLGLDELFSDILLNLRIVEVERDIEPESRPQARQVEATIETPPKADKKDPLYDNFAPEQQPPPAQEKAPADNDAPLPADEMLELGDPVDEQGPPECDHNWIMGGDPSKDEEPIEYCSGCGLVREEVKQPAMF